MVKERREANRRFSPKTQIKYHVINEMKCCQFSLQVYQPVADKISFVQKKPTCWKANDVGGGATIKHMMRRLQL